MTEEDRDTLEGRTNRELRDADKALDELLVKATQTAADIGALANEITKRVARARNAGVSIAAPSAEGFREHAQQDAGMESLGRYTKVVDLAALAALDREIGQAVGKLSEARKQKALLRL